MYVMARVPGQPRVVDLLDQRVPGQPARYKSGRGGLPPHAQRHCLEAAHGQPAVEGAQYGALRVLQGIVSPSAQAMPVSVCCSTWFGLVSMSD